MKLPFPLRSNPGAYKFHGEGRVVNMFAEDIGAENRSPVALMAIPGQVNFSTPSDVPSRGLIHVDDAARIYSLHLSSVYKIDSAGTATRITGTIPGSTAAFMAHNAANEPQIAVVSAGSGYILNTTTDAISLLTLLDAPNSVTFLDGYFVWTFADGRFQISALNDGTSNDALDFATAEAQPDGLVRGFADRSELWLFGETSTEIWTNSGGSDFPFTRLGGTFIDRGCGAAHSVVSFDNAVHWVGNDGVVYRGAGYSPQRVSTHAVERAISSLSDMSEIRGFSHSHDGHKFYVLTSASWTWVFDQATGVWHERKSYDHDDWRAWPHVSAFGKQIVGDKESGALNYLDSDTYTEAGAVIRCEVTTPDLSAYPNRLAIHQVDVEVLKAASVTLDPELMLTFSDDGGNTWSGERVVSTGQVGEYSVPVRFNRLGTSGRGGRRFKFAMSAAVARSFMLADVRAEVVRA
ncbi:MAG: packaged DNA stabilization protein [Pontixanthobacter sp.]